MNKTKSVFALLLAFVACGIVAPAYAGTDTTAALAVDKIMDWVSGSLGVVMSLLAPVTALMGAITGKLMLLTSAVGAALMCGSFGVLISLLALATVLIGAITGNPMLLPSAAGAALHAASSRASSRASLPQHSKV